MPRMPAVRLLLPRHPADTSLQTPAQQTAVRSAMSLATLPQPAESAQAPTRLFQSVRAGSAIAAPSKRIPHRQVGPPRASAPRLPRYLARRRALLEPPGTASAPHRRRLSVGPTTKAHSTQTSPVAEKSTPPRTSRSTAPPVLRGSAKGSAAGTADVPFSAARITTRSGQPVSRFAPAREQPLPPGLPKPGTPCRPRPGNHRESQDE